MRKITKESVRAFKNWERFSLSNTVVKVFEWVRQMFLHWNEIARLSWNQLMITSAGWESNTTKERLNWILEEFGLGKIRQVNWDWFLVKSDWTSEDFIRMKVFEL